MKKLLIAEYSEEMAQTLLEFLNEEFLVQKCMDGDTALYLMQEFKPDIVVLSMLLPGKDAITILQETLHKPPYIFVHSHYSNPYVERKLAELGISMMLLSPTPNTLCMRLMELAAEDYSQENTELEHLTSCLHALRFSTCRDGYRQLMEGIIKFRQDPEQHLTKELYPHVAQACGCKSAEAVEHSIRSIIQQAWDRRDPRVWDQYFPHCNKRPSNKEFISRLAYMLDGL